MFIVTEYAALNHRAMMKFQSETDLMNFVCTVFEHGDKSLENLIVQCTRSVTISRLSTLTLILNTLIPLVHRFEP